MDDTAVIAGLMASEAALGLPDNKKRHSRARRCRRHAHDAAAHNRNVECSRTVSPASQPAAAFFFFFFCFQVRQISSLMDDT